MSRRIAASGVFVLAASLVLVVPALGNATEDAVRLHLGSNGQSFVYGATTQALTTVKNSCQINSLEPLIDLSSAGTTNPGLSQYALGVRSSGSNANGTPCSQTDSAETLKFAVGSGLAGRSFRALRLDVEMTGNALVLLKLYVGTTPTIYTLQTGTSILAAQSSEPGYDTSAPYEVSSGPGDETDACAAPNSSGPNNAGNDNCLWSIDPGFAFDRIELTTTKGTVSLEGSADFGNDTGHDSLFYLANGAPDAVDDTYTTDEDITLNAPSGIDVFGVLNNDTDINGDTLSASILDDVDSGTLTLNANGSFTYDPDAEFSGTDSFIYTASDGAGGTDTATATITVRPINDPPEAQNGTVPTPEETEITLTVATDIDSEVITADCSLSPPEAGTWTDNEDGTVTFTPAENFNGDVTLTCIVTDGEGATATTSSVILVGVTPVNDLPTADDDDADTDKDVAVTIPVLGNDDDGDPNVVQPLTVTNVSDPANGTASVNLDGTVTYDPDEGFVGTDTFTYAVFDGTDTSNTATVTVEVFEVICTEETVPFESPNTIVNGTITKLTGDGPVVCKRYTLEAYDAEGGDDGRVLFLPTSESNTQVNYRAYVEFGPESAPNVTASGNSFVGRLEYDPAGGTDYRPMQWCIDPVLVDEFGVVTEGIGDVTDAELPIGETWCIASTATRGTGDGLITTWQLFGEDDPNIIKRP